MEAKLREYRARRRRQELVENTIEKLEVTKKKLTDVLLPKLFNKMDKEKKDEEVFLVSTLNYNNYVPDNYFQRQSNEILS